MSQTDLRRANLNLLLVFEVLMAERHVGRAAARLHLTQSAVSHALSRMRATLEDPLFVRNPKGIEPTPRALELAPTISQILDSARAVLLSAPTFDQHRSHTFTIGATDGAINAILVPLMERLRATAPEIQIHVLPTNRANVVAEIDRMHIDLALSAFSAPIARLSRIAIRKMQFVGIARRDHKELRGRQALTLERFIALPHLIISPQPDAPDPIEEHLHRLGMKRRVAMVQPHYLAAPLIVARTDLVAIVDRQLALMSHASQELKLFELPFDPPVTTIDMLVSSVRMQEPALRWLKTQIIELFRDPGGAAPRRRRSNV